MTKPDEENEETETLGDTAIANDAKKEMQEKHPSIAKAIASIQQLLDDNPTYPN